MPYFPVDDRFHSNAKAAAASLAALGLWALAGSWANDHLTDGDIPRHMIALLSRGATELADELVSVGLWRRTKTGYRFHQWHADADGTPRNASRSEVQAMRAKKSAGGVLGSHRRWHDSKGVIDPDCLYCKGSVNGTSHDPPIEGPNGVPMPPSPTLPLPPIKPKRSARAELSDDDPDWAAFWAAYPRREGKGAARRSWVKALEKAAASEIIAAAVAYAERRRGQDRQYTAHPTTWLNQERWTDQVPTSSTHGGWWDS